MNEVIREAIAESGQSLLGLSKRCKVHPSQLSRFMRGERDLTLEVAERICDALHLELVPEKPR